MREKFKLLIACAAFLMLGTGTALGQTFWGSGCDNCHYNVFPGTSGRSVNQCSDVIIDGAAYYHYVIYGNNAISDKETSVYGGIIKSTGKYADCSTCYSTILNSELPTSSITRYWRKDSVYYSEEYFADWNGNNDCEFHHDFLYYLGPGSTNPVYDDYYTCEKGYSYYPNGSPKLEGYIPSPDGYGCSWWSGWIEGDQYKTTPNKAAHLHGSHYTTITVNLTNVHKSLRYVDPTYQHHHWELTTWTHGAAPNALTMWAHTQDVALTHVVTGTMTVASGGLRLTETEPNRKQIADTVPSQLASILTFGSNKRLFFDNDWDGNFNGVGTVDWNGNNWGSTGQTITTETIGFNKKYTGNAAFNINGGYLALGPDCAHGKLNITSSADKIIVDAYNYLAPDGCALGPADVGYTIGASDLSTKINANELNITNSNGNCFAVNFCNLFNPTFEGVGRLLINPNVTNFKAGVTFASAQSGNIDIFSKEITTTGDFTYSSTGLNNLHVDLSIPKSHTNNCLGCGMFEVSGKFTTSHNGSSTVLIEGSGTVEIGNDYTHTNTAGTNMSHKVDVTGSIDVKGTTILTNIGGDDITFNSKNSWIKFGTAVANSFTYTPANGTSDLLINAKGHCSTLFCGDYTPGGFVEFNGPVTTTNVGAGTVKIQSDNHYVKMGNGYTHTGMTGNMLVSGNDYVDILAKDVIINRNGSGDDNIVSPAGHVYITNPFKYVQTVGDGELSILASGICSQLNACNELVYGFAKFDSPVSVTNVAGGKTTIQSTRHYVEMNSGIAYTGVDGKMLIDGYKSVDINGRHNGTTPVLPSGVVLNAAGKGNEGVYIKRTGTGNDEIHSEKGHISVTSPFTYWQTASNNSGLLVLAEGLCNEFACGSSGAYVNGYVQIDSSVTTLNTADGFVTIQSTKDHVTLGHGMIHEGSTGDLNILGSKYVDITNAYHSGKLASTNPAITIPAELDSTGLFINRKGVADDNIISDKGHIYIQQPLTYNQLAANATGLTVNAMGACNVEDCFSVFIGGYIRIDSAVTTANVTTGFTTIKSDNHYVEMNRGFAHSGVDGKLLVSGSAYVDIKDEYPNAMTHNITPITLPQTSGAVEGVYINRTGTGEDEITSGKGHVNVTNPLTFIQTLTGGSAGKGLYIWANGDCDALECDLNSPFVGGYVWLQNDVNTTNLAEGPTTIESKKHYIRIGEALQPSNYATGGHFTHKGVNGDLNILARGICFDGCDDTGLLKPDDLLAGLGLPAHARRGYVWIGDDVNITMKGGAGVEGNAVIRSYGDVVQMDDSVTFVDLTGANLWVDGQYGVRTLGPTTLTNSEYASGVTGDATGTQTVYRTIGQGFVTYLSDKGGVDFGISPDLGGDDPEILGGNTPFLYTATDDRNALLIEGYSRVFFGDSVTINMGAVSDEENTGNAKIYSPAGWIKFADTVGYTGTTGDLIIYANGGASNMDEPNILKRSHLQETGTCVDRGGFVLFDDITEISYTNTIDTGKTWIRSKNDDVVMSNMFTYTSGHSATNGEFIMQAGQDIYGRSLDDTINFVQAGDSSILLEAMKTIHIQQSLFFDREDAVTGDITLKAGYPTLAGPADILKRNASFKDATPSAALGGLNWSVGANCTPDDYISRWPENDMVGGDIWLEGRVLVDLANTASVDKTIALTMRAYNSIFIDSTFVYDQDTTTNAPINDNILLYAETGNIEAAVTRQDAGHGYVADDTVRFALNESFVNEFRMQAGNKVWVADGENMKPTNFPGCWNIGCDLLAEFDGNILFNKPFLMNNKGKGYSIISSARDIETQVMAPFIFNYDGNHKVSDNLDITAGRHLETHAMMQFNYAETDNAGSIMLEAGRLDQNDLTSYHRLGKGFEEGTTLTMKSDATKPFDPALATGDAAVKNNEFAERGTGNGSILLFDSLEFNYGGTGSILLTALNGNIESDPYLHRDPDRKSTRLNSSH